MEIEAPFDGRYRLDERLVEAATGTIYRARDLQLDSDVAVKVVPPGRLADPASLDRYRREVAIAARLRHPNLVSLLRVGEADGTHYTVMERVIGTSLRSSMGLTMASRHVVHIVRQVLDALREGHQAGLVHGTLGPDAILLAQNTTGRELPRIAGFGALALQPQRDPDSAPALLELESTHDFLAPEQLRGEPVDCRTDLFALGVITYALLCGTMPYAATTDASQREVQPMSKRAPWIDVDPLLQAFAHWLLQSSPALRPASAADAARVLDLITRDRRAAAFELGVTDNQKTTRLELITLPVAPARPATEIDGGYEQIAKPAPRKPPRRAHKPVPLALVAAALVVALLVSWHPRALLGSASATPAVPPRADVTPIGTISHHLAVGIGVETIALAGIAPELVSRYHTLQLHEFLDTEVDRVYIAGVLTDLDREVRAATDDRSSDSQSPAP